MSEENVTMKFEAEGDLIKFVEELNKRLKEVEAQIPATAKEADGFDAVAAKLGKTLGACAIALKAYQFAMKGVAEATGNMMAAAKVEQVIKATGAAAGLTAKQLNEMSAELANNSIHTGTAVQEAQALLLTFREISGDVFPQAMSAISDMAMMFGGLESSAMQVGKALSDPAEGLAALSRVGVKFTDDQKQLIASMVEAGNVAGAQAVILKQLEGQFGGVAKAIADTPAGKLQQLKNEYANLQATLGEKLIPALVAFQSALNAVTAFMADNVEVAVGLVAGAVVLLIPKIIALTTSIAGLTATMMANPLFLAAVAVAAGVMAVAAAVKKFGDNSKDASETTEVLSERTTIYEESLQHVKKVLNDISVIEEKRKKRNMSQYDQELAESDQKYNAVLEDLNNTLFYQEKSFKDAAEEAKMYGSALRMVSNGAAGVEKRSLEEQTADAQKRNAEILQLAEKANEAYNKIEESRAADRKDINTRAFAAERKARADMLKQMELDVMGAEARELKILQDTYEERTKIFKKNAAAMASLNEWEEHKRAEITKRYADERAKKEEAELERVKALKEMAAALVEQGEKDKLNAQIAAMTTVTAHEIGQYNVRLRNLDSQLSKMRALYEEDSEEYKRITKWGVDQEAEIRKQAADAERKKAEERKQKAWDDWREMIKPVEEWGGAAISSLNSVMSVFTALNSNKIKEIDASSRKEMEAINNSRMSSRAKAAEVARIEQEAAKEKYGIAVSQWKQDQAMAIVNSAAAVVKTMATVPFPANIPLAAAQTVAGGAQLAIINANKPKMQFGGIVPGRSLSGDQVDIRANSGEAVLTPAQQRNFMLMANGGGGSGGGRNVNVGDTNIVINGSADSSTVDAIGQTLAEHRQGIIELLYEADRRGEIDYSRLAIAR